MALFNNLFILFLIPNVVEKIISYHESYGNMDLARVYLGIKVHRNFVWFSFIIGLVLKNYGNGIIGLIIFALMFLKYFLTIIKWKLFIDNNNLAKTTFK